MRIHFLTTNRGKLREARARLEPLGYDVRSHPARPVEIQADSLDDVARQKALSAMDRAPTPYFVEDAGLFIDALRGFPGVYSRPAFDTIGIQGVLKLLRGVPAQGRTARFRAVIGYVDARERFHAFRGEARGRITMRARGRHGFGFDPIFQPDGSDQTFAQLAASEKGNVSHRGRALDALAKHLAAKGRV